MRFTTKTADSEMTNVKLRVLLEMRPALEGFAGIPQEVRLLFRGLKKIESLEVAGMLQTSHKILAKGVPVRHSRFSPKLDQSQQINRYSRVIISMTERPYQTLLDKVYHFLEKRLYVATHTIKTLLFGRKVYVSKFAPSNFEDFIWRALFSKTLPASDLDLVTKSDFYVNSVPWETMHKVGLSALNVAPWPIYNRLDISMADIFIGQTPYPATIVGRTKVVIRYHDAIPIFMPHTIPNKSLHQATHYYALKRNVLDGAWFACVSDATRCDLINVFPDAENRSVVIYNMISHHYFDEPSSPTRVNQIVRSRIHEGDAAKGLVIEPRFFSNKEKESFYDKRLSGELKYLLIVSTIEPRKNHSRLLAAWEIIRETDPSIKLIIVGGLGWDYDQIIRGFRPWIDRGEIFMLSSVPAPDLRVLYKHASATVCPSLGEGFDYSGVEAMASGGITIASDIPVHREVYADAAEYFDPYSTISLVKSLKKVLYDDKSDELRDRMRQRGIEIVKRYMPESILPQWEAFLHRVASED